MWKRRSAEEGLNQKEAAELLGWTRGAFCQYLNGHTKLNPEALIKLANFFSVDPRELDPAIEQFLPNTRSYPVFYKLSDANSKQKNVTKTSVTLEQRHKFQLIKIDQAITWTVKGKANTIAAGHLGCIGKPDPQMINEDSLWVVKLKDRSYFQIMEDMYLPLKKDISQKYLLWGIYMDTWTE